MIPKSLLVNGAAVSLDKLTSAQQIPLPAIYLGWALYTGDMAGVRLLLWTLGGQPFALWVVNNREVPVTVEADGDHEFDLWPTSGYRFSNESFERSLGKDIALPKQVDTHVINSTLVPDIKMTTNTGSAEMEFFDPLHEWAKKYGKSKRIVEACFSYLHWQVRRPRWHLHETGLPMWLVDASNVLPKFSVWSANNEGLNAGDPNHPDIRELLTGHDLGLGPEFLFALTNFACFGIQHFGAWDAAEQEHKGARAWLGQPRQAGWGIDVLCEIAKRLPKEHAALAEILKTRARDMRGLALKLLGSANWWADWTQSRVKEIAAAKKDQIQPWEMSILAFGCAKEHPAYGREVLDAQYDIFADSRGFPLYAVTSDFKVKVEAPPEKLGVAGYLLPAMILSEYGKGSERWEILTAAYKNYLKYDNPIGVSLAGPVIP